MVVAYSLNLEAILRQNWDPSTPTDSCGWGLRNDRSGFEN